MRAATKACSTTVSARVTTGRPAEVPHAAPATINTTATTIFESRNLLITMPDGTSGQGPMSQRHSPHRGRADAVSRDHPAEVEGGAGARRTSHRIKAGRLVGHAACRPNEAPAAEQPYRIV